MTIAHIQAALGDCKRIHSSQCTIKTSFEQTSLPNFYILDASDEQPAKIVTNEKGEYQLIVKNDNATEISFVKVDKCLLTDNNSKCDCILFNRDKCFFVEIKTSNAGTRSAKRRKAVDQLGFTIELIRDNQVDLSQLNTKAIICFKSEQTRPIRASFNSQQAVFLEKYNISLEEGNEVIF